MPQRKNVIVGGPRSKVHSVVVHQSRYLTRCGMYGEPNPDGWMRWIDWPVTCRTCRKLDLRAEASPTSERTP